jgi:hypothetical protein
MGSREPQSIIRVQRRSKGAAARGISLYSLLAVS